MRVIVADSYWYDVGAPVGDSIVGDLVMKKTSIKWRLFRFGKQFIPVND